MGRLSKAVLKHRIPHAAATLVAPPNLAKRLECGGSPPLSKWSATMDQTFGLNVGVQNPIMSGWPPNFPH
jgi:hypothetical protein